MKDNFTWATGNHQIKTGGEFRAYRSDAVVENLFAGQYVFPNVAGFVAGRPVQLVVQVGNPLIPLSSNIFAAFIQDDWRATSTLTLNLGVRYDYTDSTIPEISSGEILDFGGDFLPLQGREIRRSAATRTTWRLGWGSCGRQVPNRRSTGGLASITTR